jgi:hypothetical protein
MSAIESERTAWTDALASMRETVAAATVRADAAEASLLISRAEVEEMRQRERARKALAFLKRIRAA